MFATATRTQGQAKERRKHQRVNVELMGRYMLESRREFPCQTVNISPGGLALVAPMSGALGERVVVYLDQVGRVEGSIVRLLPNGFAIAFSATIRKRDKLASQLTWLANRQILGMPEDRRHERLQPRNPRTIITLDNGVQSVARLIDVSTSGAGVSTHRGRPPAGESGPPLRQRRGGGVRPHPHRAGDRQRRHRAAVSGSARQRA
jgi:hypothetical protein